MSTTPASRRLVRLDQKSHGVRWADDHSGMLAHVKLVSPLPASAYFLSPSPVRNGPPSPATEEDGEEGRSRYGVSLESPALANFTNPGLLGSTFRYGQFASAMSGGNDGDGGYDDGGFDDPDLADAESRDADDATAAAAVASAAASSTRSLSGMLSGTAAAFAASSVAAGRARSAAAPFTTAASAAAAKYSANLGSPVLGSPRSTGDDMAGEDTRDAADTYGVAPAAAYFSSSSSASSSSVSAASMSQRFNGVTAPASAAVTARSTASALEMLSSVMLGSTGGARTTSSSGSRSGPVVVPAAGRRVAGPVPIAAPTAAPAAVGAMAMSGTLQRGRSPSPATTGPTAAARPSSATLETTRPPAPAAATRQPSPAPARGAAAPVAITAANRSTARAPSPAASSRAVLTPRPSSAASLTAARAPSPAASRPAVTSAGGSYAQARRPSWTQQQQQPSLGVMVPAPAAGGGARAPSPRPTSASSTSAQLSQSQRARAPSPAAAAAAAGIAASRAPTAAPATGRRAQSQVAPTAVQQQVTVQLSHSRPAPRPQEPSRGSPGKPIVQVETVELAEVAVEAEAPVEATVEAAMDEQDGDVAAAEERAEWDSASEIEEAQQQQPAAVVEVLPFSGSLRGPTAFSRALAGAAVYVPAPLPSASSSAAAATAAPQRTSPSAPAAEEHAVTENEVEAAADRESEEELEQNGLEEGTMSEQDATPRDGSLQLSRLLPKIAAPLDPSTMAAVFEAAMQGTLRTHEPTREEEEQLVQAAEAAAIEARAEADGVGRGASDLSATLSARSSAAALPRPAVPVRPLASPATHPVRKAADVSGTPIAGFLTARSPEKAAAAAIRGSASGTAQAETVAAAVPVASGANAAILVGSEGESVFAVRPAVRALGTSSSFSTAHRIGTGAGEGAAAGTSTPLAQRFERAAADSTPSRAGTSTRPGSGGHSRRGSATSLLSESGSVVKSPSTRELSKIAGPDALKPQTQPAAAASLGLAGAKYAAKLRELKEQPVVLPVSALGSAALAPEEAEALRAMRPGVRRSGTSTPTRSNSNSSAASGTPTSGAAVRPGSASSVAAHGRRGSSASVGSIGSTGSANKGRPVTPTQRTSRPGSSGGVVTPAAARNVIPSPAASGIVAALLDRRANPARYGVPAASPASGLAVTTPLSRTWQASQRPSSATPSMRTPASFSASQVYGSSATPADARRVMGRLSTSPAPQTVATTPRGGSFGSRGGVSTPTAASRSGRPVTPQNSRVGTTGAAPLIEMRDGQAYALVPLQQLTTSTVSAARMTPTGYAARTRPASASTIPTRNIVAPSVAFNAGLGATATSAAVLSATQAAAAAGRGAVRTLSPARSRAGPDASVLSPTTKLVARLLSAMGPTGAQPRTVPSGGVLGRLGK